MKHTIACRKLYSTSLNIQLNHSSLDQSMVLLQIYVKAKCALQDITDGKQTRNFQLSTALDISKTDQSPRYIDQLYYEPSCHTDDLPNLMPGRDGSRDWLMNVWTSSRVRILLKWLREVITRKFANWSWFLSFPLYMGQE